jgi:hypothetical protein
MNQVITQHHGSPVHLAPVNAHDSDMFSVIARMATDPEADIEKLDRLLQMKQRMDDTASQKSFNGAMAACQAEMPRIIAGTSNGHTKSTYADLATIYTVAKPIAAKHGLSFSTMPCKSETSHHLGVKWVLRHADGHTESGETEIPTDDRGTNGTVNKTGTHAFGSSNTYARRYLFCMIFDIAIGKDDDGNAGGGKPDPLISAAQYIEVRDLAGEIGVDESEICAHARVDDLRELTVKSFQTVLKKLQITRDERAAKAKDIEVIAVDLNGAGNA